VAKKHDLREKLHLFMYNDDVAAIKQSYMSSRPIAEPRQLKSVLATKKLVSGRHETATLCEKFHWCQCKHRPLSRDCCRDKFVACVKEAEKRINLRYLLSSGRTRSSNSRNWINSLRRWFRQYKHRIGSSTESFDGDSRRRLRCRENF